MKKYVLICSVILSSLSFAASHDSHQNHSSENMMDNMPMMQTHHNNSSPCNMMQQMPGWKADKKMMKSRMMYMTPEMQKNMIDIEQKELDIRKAMLDDKVDWNKVEKLNKEIGEIRAKMQTDMMKKNYESMKAAPTDPANKQ
jgi:Spy/CpxP family protein refolding chaperone